MADAPASPNGFTAIEVLIVVALVSLLLMGLTSVGPSRELARAARELAGSVAAVRALALATGRPISHPAAPCVGEAIAGVTHATPTNVVRAPARGLLFNPDGLPRTCDGGGVGNATILLEHRGRQAAVIISSLGRVRWELR